MLRYFVNAQRRLRRTLDDENCERPGWVEVSADDYDAFGIETRVRYTPTQLRALWAVGSQAKTAYLTRLPDRQWSLVADNHTADYGLFPSRKAAATYAAQHLLLLVRPPI